jgi:hypothetical protein
MVRAKMRANTGQLHSFRENLNLLVQSWLSAVAWLLFLTIFEFDITRSGLLDALSF